MTVIAWDGKTLAADKRACGASFMYSVTKIFRTEDRIVGFSGQGDLLGFVRNWFLTGRDPEKYPTAPDADKMFTLAITRDGVIEKYETSPYPIIVEASFFALGSGQDYAMAAMHLGCDARRAVEVACALDETCGNGIDTLTLE